MLRHKNNWRIGHYSKYFLKEFSNCFIAYTNFKFVKKSRSFVMVWKRRDRLKFGWNEGCLHFDTILCITFKIILNHQYCVHTHLYTPFHLFHKSSLSLLRTIFKIGYYIPYSKRPHFAISKRFNGSILSTNSTVVFVMLACIQNCS